MRLKSVLRALKHPRSAVKAKFDHLVHLSAPAQLHQIFMAATVVTESPHEALEFFLKDTPKFIAPTKAQGDLFPVFYDSGPRLQELVRSVIDAYAPQVVVETGVAHGRLTRVVLSALEGQSRAGRPALHSIDTDPRTEHADILANPLWTFHCVTESNNLETILAKIGRIDLFIHDSDHRYPNQALEFSLAWESLSEGGFLVADDINWSNAFLDFCSARKLNPIVVSDTTKLAGIVRKTASE